MEMCVWKVEHVLNWMTNDYSTSYSHPVHIQYPTKPWLSIGSIHDLAPPLWVYFIWGMGLEPSKRNMYPGTIPKSIPSHPTPSYLSPCLSICPSIYPIQSYITLNLLHLSIYLSTNPPICLSIRLSIYPSIYSSIRFSLSLSAYWHLGDWLRCLGRGRGANGWDWGPRDRLKKHRRKGGKMPLGNAL